MRQIQTGTKIRRLNPTDMRALSAFLLSLPAEDRLLRFGILTSDAAIRRYVATLDWSRTIVIGCFGGYILRGAVELSAPLPGRPDWREAAVTIDKAWRGCGLGRRLLAEAQAQAADAGCSRLVFHWQPDNVGFSGFLRACGGTVQIYPSLGWLDMPSHRPTAQQQHGRPHPAIMQGRAA